MTKTGGSSEKINYFLRLKKQIERKIFIETFQLLHPKINISDYRYFGLGSIYFVDFILFHKYLHINKMISIEGDPDELKRASFNKPYDFIDLFPSMSTKFLERDIDWKEKLFIWLDYDLWLESESAKIFTRDINIVARNAKRYDFFLISIDCRVDDKEKFKTLMYDLDLKITYKDATATNLPSTLNMFVREYMQKGLNKRADRMTYLQLFNLTYKDTAKMYTFGCIFLDENEVDDFKIFCAKKQFKFINFEGKPIDIDCPIITPREKYYLDSCINKQRECRVEEKKVAISKEKIKAYEKYYKYYPQFVESIY